MAKRKKYLHQIGTHVGGKLKTYATRGTKPPLPHSHSVKELNTKAGTTGGKPAPDGKHAMTFTKSKVHPRSQSLGHTTVKRRTKKPKSY